ncbi:hypothetical protein MWH28_07745 [Natroniella sulfidigena]|uniref:hypothetical protein n=1 Tax=Natroniella sulfidigena TaxID=723921 RepID=UPI00200A5094|nr:hypothetical protein [Natroniella sulfidigena]MCK8817252.1 hypothetical protein [Natroniella sulfidigena]
MHLIECLKKKDKEDLSQVATQHHIYYNPNFSKAWVSKEIKQKLSDPVYLKEFIKKELKPKTLSTIKRLLSTEPINKESLQLSTYQRLIELGLIYEQNNFCYFPYEIKKILIDLFSDDQPQKTVSESNPTETKTTKQESYSEAPEVRIKCTPSFFHYLLLFLGHIHISDDSNKDKLQAFINKLNQSSISNSKLFNYLKQYSAQNQLLEKSNYTVKDNIDKWLDTSYKQKILTGIETFFPRYAQKLRNTIAVLSYYPLQQQIPFNFFIKQVDYHHSNLEQLKLLELINIFIIEDKHIKLTPLCWKLFNSKTKCNLSKPKINNQQLIIAGTTELKSLWPIFQMNSSLKIDKDDITMKIDARSNLSL